ncbi:hypothetical protein [uncultured Draconibacterium sp.]|uniref:hypothetical protein n=1 Tax=uncultured Draconibacterium sp. TaxID=1573823 RepID=UPI0032172494
MTTIRKNRRLVLILSGALLILLIPFIAIQISNEVNWSVFDFMTAGLILLSLGIMIEIILRKVPKKVHRFALLAVLLFIFILIWAELAVEIF